MRLFFSWCLEHVISIFLPSLVEIRLGDFGLLVIYIIVYFGVVFELVFHICINSNPCVFSNPNRSLIEFLAVLFSVWFLKFCLVESPSIFGNILLMEAYMSTRPSRKMDSTTEFMYIHTEGNFEETGLFYWFAVDLF